MNKIIDHYDKVAGQYDKLHNRPQDIVADKELVAILWPALNSADRILDPDCGTGFFLDHIQWSPETYLGVEPSNGMCREFQRKHPNYTLSHSYLTKAIVRRFKPSLVLGLYAVGDHLSSQDIDLIAQIDYFMMFSLPSITDPNNPIYQDQNRQQIIENNQQRLEGSCRSFAGSYLIITTRL